MVKVEDAVPAVKRWFHGCEGRWLVILDSADTIDNDRDKSYIDLAYFMPDTPGVHVVITSRSSTAKKITMLDAVESDRYEATGGDRAVSVVRDADRGRAGCDKRIRCNRERAWVFGLGDHPGRLVCVDDGSL